MAKRIPIKLSRQFRKVAESRHPHNIITWSRRRNYGYYYEPTFKEWQFYYDGPGDYTYTLRERNVRNVELYK